MHIDIKKTEQNASRFFKIHNFMFLTHPSGQTSSTGSDPQWTVDHRNVFFYIADRINID